MVQVQRKESAPEAHIAVNKSRRKKYDKNSEMPSYYLQDGEEFQIELFNPLDDDVLAKIHMNGENISESGIVLRPGERVFLDRYIDTDSKFKFDTYFADDSEEGRKAIRNNGNVKVEFFKKDENNEDDLKEMMRDLREKMDKYRPPYSPYPYPYPGPPLPEKPFIPYCGPADRFKVNDCKLRDVQAYTTEDNNLDLETGSGCSTYTTNSVNLTGSLSTSNSDSIETGRVEEGGRSEQKFEKVNKAFHDEPYEVVKYKLYPMSQKPKTSEDLKEVRRYCHQCGAKTKPKYNFCPVCGEKL